MKKVILLFAISILSFLNLPAQPNPDESRVTVDATGEVLVPADRIHFRVNITQFKQDAREAFQLHKEQEKYLSELLLDEGIADSNITANPISISHVRRYSNTDQSGYETQQQVMIVMNDVTQFESMQIKLIENGFTNFSGSFSAANLDDASDQALQKAVEEARRKADLLAEAAGKQITDVVTINYHSSRPYASRSGNMEMVAYDAGSGSLLQFERTIPVRENVSMQFRID
ncbi:SIMPL domain-containing protein [Rhodohalobacter sulfatireducens]|uniref:SIMPL domain-containing protein n=1 Tax=Rhodohalobacter sulfatireducens TaxID=2911366 RepID=A0ABS9KBP1_9BACT|nr:SIMPL domain-containing protein [Rhodohalobacter sulfatireducens]MCG2588269.1 SIMPL domain-containing protein [Rhodohalobacter sulfatireducens]